MTTPGLMTRLWELRMSALDLNSAGDVVGVDLDAWRQADELGAVVGEDMAAVWNMPRNNGAHSAWMRYPEHILGIARPNDDETCCRLYACDVAERALDLYGGDVDPRSREAIRVARLHARGEATGEELDHARGAAWVAASTKASTNAAWVAWAATDTDPAHAAWTAQHTSISTVIQASARDDVRTAQDSARREQWTILLEYVRGER